MGELKIELTTVQRNLSFLGPLTGKVIVTVVAAQLIPEEKRRGEL